MKRKIKPKKKIKLVAKPLSEVELRFAQAWAGSKSSKSNFGANFRPTPEEVREQMKVVAFHEAAHVVARFFSAIDAGHTESVSIIPGGGSLGREVFSTSFATAGWSPKHAVWQLAVGRALLLQILAGRGAEYLICTKGRPEPVYNPRAFDLIFIGTDLSEAQDLAKRMAMPGLSSHRILKEAAKWTLKMLKIPVVWSAVKRLAQLLLERGEVNDFDLILSTCREVFCLVLRRNSPQWKRYLFLRKCDEEAKFGPSQRQDG